LRWRLRLWRSGYRRLRRLLCRGGCRLLCRGGRRLLNWRLRRLTTRCQCGCCQGCTARRDAAKKHSSSHAFVAPCFRTIC
jgi:hypothetical protein